MKIKQDLETGAVRYELAANEEYSTEEHLSAVSEFLNTQAIEIFRLRNSYRKIIYRLKKLEKSNGTSTIDG